MSKFCSLFSGSSGNCEYISSSESSILIDAGRSAKQISEALLQREIDPYSIDAIFVTHEHIDHARGLRVFANKYNVDVYATGGTAQGLRRCNMTDEKTRLKIIGGVQSVGDMKIGFFHTSHDTLESCGYVIDMPDGRKIAVCTDLGVMTAEVQNAVEGADLVLLESNHDVNMLMNGNYPYPLKMRIAGNRGHLCNEECGKELVRLVKSGATRLFLGHLSRENNIPELALQNAVSELTLAGMKEGFDYEISVCSPINRGKVTVF
jgi:phosphoribosyl 1,2-cyclic phosphodiesterase